MNVFDHPSFDDHELVTFVADPSVGLRAVIAVHSTVLGPSSGGTRMWRYASADEQLTDALRLSRAMSYKNAMADLPLGGGKGVIWRPDGDFDRPALFEAYGHGIDALGGRYITAEDVGVGVEDMRAVRRATRFVAGLPEGEAASGDPSPVTAKGVFFGMQNVARRALGRDDLMGVRVAVQGVGSVGGYLCRHLHAAGADLVVSDVDEALVEQAVKEFNARAVGIDEIYDADMDIFAPCALGGAISPETIDRLKAKAIAGGANNQLLTPELGDALHKKGVLYAPDFVINGGGIINVAAEVSGHYDPDWVEAKVIQLIASLEEVFERAEREDRPTHRVADDMARERIDRARTVKETA